MFMFWLYWLLSTESLGGIGCCINRMCLGRSGHRQISLLVVVQHCVQHLVDWLFGSILFGGSSFAFLVLVVM